MDLCFNDNKNETWMLFPCLTAGGTAQGGWTLKRRGRGGLLARVIVDVNTAGLKMPYNRFMRTDKHSSRTNTNTACKHCLFTKQQPPQGTLKSPLNQPIKAYFSGQHQLPVSLHLTLHRPNIFGAERSYNTSHPLTSFTCNSWPWNNAISLDDGLKTTALRGHFTPSASLEF